MKSWKNTTINKFFIVFTIYLFSNLSQAAWTEVGKVTRVHSGHGDGVIFFSTETQVTVASCTTNIGYTINENASNSNRMYSLLLSAYISKTPISIATTGACIGGRPAVDAVQYKDVGEPF